MLEARYRCIGSRPWWAGFGLGLLLCVPLWAAGADGGFVTLHGEVVSSAPLGLLQVELRPAFAGDRTFVVRGEVSPLGEFQFSSVRPGWYNIRVVDESTRSVQEKQVLVDGNSTITMELQEPKRQAGRSGSVSVGQLAQKVPRAASKEFKAGMKAIKSGTAEVATMHLKKALAIYPKYVDALNALGLCDVMRQHRRQAADEFRAAVALDPYHAASWSNLSVVLYALKQFGEAADAAQRAVSLDAGLIKARFMLGMSLHALKNEDKAALVYLQESADQFPQAHITVSEILAANGSRADAAQHVRLYLEHFDGSVDRAAAEKWLEELEAPPQQRSAAVYPSGEAKP